jgi:hypothetical protein
MIPFAGLLIEFLPKIIAMIQHIKAQSSKTTEQILDEAGVILEDNDRKLLDDLIRLGVI